MSTHEQIELALWNRLESPQLYGDNEALVIGIQTRKGEGKPVVVGIGRRASGAACSALFFSGVIKMIIDVDKTATDLVLDDDEGEE